MAVKSLLDTVFTRLKEALPGLTAERAAAWKDYTSLGAGLSDFLLVRPKTLEGLLAVLRLLREYPVNARVLGAGTNFVGSDYETPDVFIRLDNGYFTRISGAGKNMLECRSGLRLSELIAHAAEQGLGGMAELSGIPGTVGGAVIMNAGACGKEISGFVRMIEGVKIRDNSLYLWDSTQGGWGYRKSPVPKDVIVTGAVFEFAPVNPEEEKRRIAAEKLRRREATPPGRSAGSVFRNPANAESAGALLERAECKGKCAGAFRVSEKHANWIVSEDAETPASERDFVRLASEMHAKVRQTTGISLQTELCFANMESGKSIGNAGSGKLKIIVLKGGVSSEREVSLVSGKIVAEALRKAGHEVVEYDIKKLEITDEMRRADVVYPVLHGGFGEDGRLQKLMEEAGLKFVGCPSGACIDAMDKVASKKIMDRAGIRNAPSAVVDSPDCPFIDKFGLPVIVKPPCEGSTVGLTLVESPEQWRGALELALKHDKAALVEKYIKGVEGTVGILDGKALPMIEIRYPGKLYDYDAKYTHSLGETKEICPPTGISEAAQKEAAELSLRFYRALGARDMLRVDVIVDSEDKVWVLEANTLPGCTPSSLLPRAASVAGIPFPEMCSNLAEAAFKR